MATPDQCTELIVWSWEWFIKLGYNKSLKEILRNIVKVYSLRSNKFGKSSYHNYPNDILKILKNYFDDAK